MSSINEDVPHLAESGNREEKGPIFVFSLGDPCGKKTGFLFFRWFDILFFGRPQFWCFDQVWAKLIDVGEEDIDGKKRSTRAVRTSARGGC
ncbi:MAG: hypothetical protein Q8P67_09370 [archaeon]|nr:hypothetical protein [archaeon]